MEKENVNSIYVQYIEVSKKLQNRCEVAGKTHVARRLAKCRVFKGSETVAELANLFTSPQGIEFCLATNFPNLATLRMFKSYDTTQWGIYIDAGVITLKNPSKAILIGRTTATVYCDTCDRHTVVTMHGAKATLVASKWSVVRCECGRGTTIIKRTADNAIIL